MAGEAHRYAADRASRAASQATEKAREYTILAAGDVGGLLLSGMVTDPDAADKDMRQWYKWSTGLELPSDAKLIAGKCITVLPVGDCYFLKIKVPGFESHLNADYEAHKESASLSQPPDWKKDLPFWDEAEIRKGKHYSRFYKSPDGTPWIVSATYDAKTGILYFTSDQCRD